ncbi:MAG: hypothetical protein Tsb002_25500 [Wenzhouxiangellaceae bacterium]
MLRSLIIVCLLFSALAAPLHAQEPATAAAAEALTDFPDNLPRNPQLLQVYSVQALQEGQHEEFVRILKFARTLRPDDPQLMAQLVAGYALLNDKPNAYSIMLRMQRQGLSFDFDQIEQTASIRSTEVYKHINTLLKQLGQPVGDATAAFTLPATATMPETIAWDAANQQLIIGTVRDGQLLQLSRDGQPQTQAPALDNEGLWAIFGLAVDNERQRLWVSSTAVGQWNGYKASDYGLSSLTAFDLKNGQPISTHRLVPDGEPHGLANLALGNDGSVYVADSRQPMVHVLRPGEEQLQTLFHNPSLTSIRGMAYDPQRQLLYLADREAGIGIWNDADQKLYRLINNDDQNVTGIDGLSLWNGQLIIVQNGINPNRVMRLELTEDGLRIARHQVLAAALESFAGPSYGTVAGDEFYLLGANHWGAYDINGQRLPGTRVDAVPVIRIALKEADAAEE